MMLPIKVAISVNKCDSGGQKSLVMAYMRNFSSDRIKFDLIVDEDSNSIPFDEVKALGGHVYVVPPYQKIVSHMKALYKLYTREKYDVLYAANNTMNIFPLFVANLAGIKVRVSESLTTASKLEKKKTMMKNVLKRFSHCFCNYYMANGIQSAEYQFGKKTTQDGKVAIFLNPVDAEKNDFSPLIRKETREKFGWTDKVVYGTIARFEKQKNPLFLIEVMNEIKNRQENALFVIIGIGSMEQEMKAKIAEYGFGDRMNWLGRREDIRQFYNAFDAFLLPSLYEGFPIVGVESQAAGLPVFFSDAVTREAGIEELGHFIELEKSAKEWADIIIPETSKLMQNRRGRKDYLKQNGFDAASEAERLTQYFENAVKEQK